MEEGFYMGGNVFMDMLDTEADNQFWQLGFGIEAGTWYLEVRGNYCLPLSGRQLAEEIRTRETFTNSRTRANQSTTPLNQPFVTGNSIQQDALFTTRRATTTSTTERLFQRFEDGQEGWDAEVAVLVPGLDKYCNHKLIGGYFKFDKQTFGPQTAGTGNMEGWKAAWSSVLCRLRFTRNRDEGCGEMTTLLDLSFVLTPNFPDSSSCAFCLSKTPRPSESRW